MSLLDSLPSSNPVSFCSFHESKNYFYIISRVCRVMLEMSSRYVDNWSHCQLVFIQRRKNYTKAMQNLRSKTDYKFPYYKTLTPPYW